MPISSGFSADRPSAMHRTQLTRPIRRPQIIARARQFQEDLRTKQRHVPFGKGAAGRPSVPERPTAAVKQASRSNTFTLPKKIEQQSNVKTTKELPKLKGRAPSPAFLPPPPPPPARAPRKELINYHSAAPVRPTLKAIPSMNDQRRPVRFASEVNYAYPSASSAWTNTHHHHHPPPPPPVANRTTRTIHDNNYPNSQHRTTFTDYPSNTVPQPVVHVVRRPAPRNYVYVDDNDDDRVIVDPPATQIIRRRRRRQPEVIYIDEDDDYVDDDVIYVDENGRQVEYIYDEPVRYRTYPKIRQTNATNVVYQ